MFAGRAPGRGRSGSQRCTKCHWKRWWILQELLLNLTTTPPSKHLQKKKMLEDVDLRAPALAHGAADT